MSGQKLRAPEVGNAVDTVKQGLVSGACGSQESFLFFYFIFLCAWRHVLGCACMSCISVGATCPPRHVPGRLALAPRALGLINLAWNSSPAQVSSGAKRCQALSSVVKHAHVGELECMSDIVGTPNYSPVAVSIKVCHGLSWSAWSAMVCLVCYGLLWSIMLGAV